MRKTFSSQFKAKVVLEILKEEKSLAQISSQYEVHVNQLSKWKKVVIEKMHELLEDGRRKDDIEKEAHEKQLQELYAEIGELTTRLNWLKKKSGINCK